MKKIPTLFERNPDNRSLVLPVYSDGTEWVKNGEGIATRKYDGACCYIDTDKKLFKRREIKPGKQIPGGFIELNFDEVTGKRVGWLAVSENDPSDKYYIEGFNWLINNWASFNKDQTYELCGPKVQGNPENLNEHILIDHSKADMYPDCPRDFDGLKEWLSTKDIEGIVFHHLDGRMIKIKKRDFGLK